MVRYLNLAIVLLLQVACISFSHPTDSLSISLEDRLQQLTDNYMKISDAFAAKDARLEKLVSKVTQLELKVEELKIENQKQQEIIVILQQKIEEQPADHSLPSNKNIPNLTHPVSVTGMPESCADLKYMGHSANGMYLIMGTEQVETVYCDFAALPTDASFQTWIGKVDVKSSPVYFYVQRNNSFGAVGRPIPFQLQVLNIGSAMNLTSGIFTAPTTGTYTFFFNGVGDVNSACDCVIKIGIYLNGNRVGSGVGEEIDSRVWQYESFSIQSTLNLQKGDEISLQIYSLSEGNYLYDDPYHFNHFSGWLLDENFSQSLNV